MQRMNYESLPFASVMVHCWCIFVSLLYLLLWESNISSSDTTTASFFSPLSSFLFLLGHLPIATQIKNVSLLPSFVKVILAVQLSAFVMAILFGAPLIRDYDKTFAFSITVAALLFAPVISEAEIYKSFLTMNKFTELLEVIARSSVFTVLGAWISAVVIPLDWDRPWQVWPEPCCIGALLGSIVDHAVSLFHTWNGKKQTKSRFL